MDSVLNYSNSFIGNTSEGVETFEKNVSDYPYSSLANFLLLCHYKKEDPKKFENFSKKAILYFSNPHWLNFQIQYTVAEETVSEIVEFSNLGEEAPGLSEVEITKTEYKIEHPNKIIEPEVPTENSLSQENSEAIIEENNEVPIEEKIEPAEIEKVEETVEKNEEPIIEEAPNQTNETEPQQETPNIHQEEKEQKEFTITSTSTDNKNEELLFEPLSMSDYFASQGIDIKPELLLNDKLGKQMKSFTDWLKDMKRLHANKLPDQNPAVERMIQMKAEKSNAEADILTETMAEVLLKQGKPEKAIELYEKLSLMNPSKSIYFAAKIDSIKNQ